jgi:hypothetical protein
MRNCEVGDLFLILEVHFVRHVNCVALRGMLCLLEGAETTSFGVLRLL